MAKWGEGDPRWIVEERADATNVNNWHWTEKNASAWSKEKLKTLLEKEKIEDDTFSCEITEVTSIDGEASANNRKAKLIFFYEWTVKAEWKGYVTGQDMKYTGNLEIPNLSEEHEPKDVDVDITIKGEKISDEAYRVKEFMRIKGAEMVRTQLAKYIADLKEEFSQGMILPAKKAEDKLLETKKQENKVKSRMNAPVQSSNQNVGERIHCKKLNATENFKCQAGDLYRALTEKSMVCAFTRGEAEIDAESGGKFLLFGGNISGEFKNLTLNKKIVMRWRAKSWPSEHYSTVTLELNEQADSTDVCLTQTGIPENEYDRTKEGWKRYYWEPIKQTFGFGVRLF